MEEKKQSSAGIIICLVIMALLAGAWVVIFVIGTGPARKFDKMNEKALMCINNRDYEGAVDEYREMLKIAPGNDRALSGLNRAYAMWADYLESDGEPELAAEVLEEEVDYLAELNETVDSKRISRMIQEVEQNAKDILADDTQKPDPFAQPTPDPGDPTQQRPADDPTVLLGAAYDYMGKGDYSGMLQVDGSTQADELVAQMKQRGQDVFIFGDDYSGEKDFTGQAVGLYIIPDGYYFYYGDYTDGERSGFGTSYWKNGDGTYEMYQGYWDNDAPNGTGTITNRDDYNNTTTMVSGTFLDGHQDGDMSIDVVDAWGKISHGEYKATDGDAPEIKVSGSDPVFDSYVDYGYIPYVQLDDGTVQYYPADTERLGALGYRRR